jgi:maleylacetate reductase
MTRFHYTAYSQEVLFATGALDQLAEAAERHGWQRLLVCASGSARRAGWLDRIAGLLGQGLLAVYDNARPHVPEAQVTEALHAAQAAQAEAVIGLGGGSPIGMAKAVAALLADARGLPPGQGVPVIAIPTTYAGSEMTAVYGVTRELPDGPRKVTAADPRIAPRLVIYDPVLTLGLPPDLTAASGINALAHCVEALYAANRNPLSTAAAAAGAGHIHRALPRCHDAARVPTPSDVMPPGAPVVTTSVVGAAADSSLAVRAEMLLGAHLAGAALATVAMALHHGLCHVLGGAAGVPHGVANAIILPHAMRFNQPATSLQQATLAQAMGLVPSDTEPRAAAETAARRVEQLVAALGLPQRLRDAGVERAALPRLARLAFENRTVQNNPRPITDPAQLETLLIDAW